MNKSDRTRMKEVALSLERVLSLPREGEIHLFLAQHHFLFSFLSSDGFVRSKLRLADAYVPDFVVVGNFIPLMNDPRPRVTFIEIERANAPLFTQHGDPTSFITHAIRQVQDWKRWVTENRPYLHRVLQRLAEERDSKDAASGSLVADC